MVRFAYLGLFTHFVLAPFYWVAVTSIKPQEDLVTIPPVFFPTHPTGLNYETGLDHLRG